MSEMEKINDWGIELPEPNSIAALEYQEKLLFLEKLQAGYGPLRAGQAGPGWSPQHTEVVMRDPDMRQLISIIQNMKDEDVERGMYIAAKTGNVTAGIFWLLNRQPEQWRDTKKIVIERSDKVSVEIVHSVKQSALELLRQAGVPALQPGGALDVVEAKVVSES